MRFEITRTMLNKQKGKEIIQLGVISSPLELNENENCIVITNTVELVINETRCYNEE